MMFKRLLRNIEFKKLWITFAIYFGGLLVLAIFMDQVAMPIIVHKGDELLCQFMVYRYIDWSWKITYFLEP